MVQIKTETINMNVQKAVPVVDASAKIGVVNLPASAWVGENNLYSQVVDIAGVTANSQVDLTPSVEQLAVFYDKSLAFVAENENGIVTVYAIGQKLEDDYTMQVTMTDVKYSGKIIGVTVGTPTSPKAMSEKLKPELKAYVDEAILGGEW